MAFIMYYYVLCEHLKYSVLWLKRINLEFARHCQERKIT